MGLYAARVIWESSAQAEASNGSQAMILADADNSFKAFAPPHVAAIVLTVAAAAALTVWARKAKSARVTGGIRLAVAVVMVGNEFVYMIIGLAIQPLAEFAKGFLPLHVCGAAIFLTAWTLWRKDQYVYEIAYFWGLGGTVQAILTPNLSAGFPSYWFFTFFIAHCATVVGVVFATWGMNMRPARGAVLRVVVVSNLYLAAVAGANILLDANYMFLRRPPAGQSPFFFLPWPWYIIFLEVVGLGFVLLLYLPFVLSRRTGRTGLSNAT